MSRCRNYGAMHYNCLMSTQPPYQPPAPQTPRPQPPFTPGNVIDQGTARALSAVAHGAIAFGLFGVGFLLSLAISGVIWLYAKRSPEVRFHSEQAGCYQCSVLVINFVFVIILGATTGFSLFNLLQGRSDWGMGGVAIAGLVLFAIWFLGTILLGLYGAVMVLMGRKFKYPIIGDRFERET